MTLLFIYRMIHNVPLSASTTGYYRDGVDEMFTEESQSSVGFFCWMFAGVGRKLLIWIRIVKFEDRHVLSSSGGMLSKILPPFKLGLGGRIGNGNQYMSWIGRDDLG